ncbi:DUF6064 family protein [uncultured Piscinibacter sp.]|uniref:DUF6064 family protein n=1 Tax=uncultured Piscinibacter sp. TaxID=1131835 RepID=UPI0026141407|nr:DUF6064 family protein [uncultured Piscinibacter sp.]
MTPCPVTLFNLGALLLTSAPVPRRLLVNPLAWSLVGGSAAFMLSVPQDWHLLFSGPTIVLLILRDRRRAAAHATAWAKFLSRSRSVRVGLGQAVSRR